MAKIIKDTRETINVDLELENIKSKIKITEKKKPEKKTKITSKDTKNTKKKVTSKKNKKGGILLFFKEVRSEVSKVKWPSKKDMVKYSIATIVFVIFFALFFYLINLIIALLKAGV